MHLVSSVCQSVGQSAKSKEELSVQGFCESNNHADAVNQLAKAVIHELPLLASMP